MTTHNAVLVAASRNKAAEALELARQSRQDGWEAAHAGYLPEVLYWRALADAIAQRARDVVQEVTQI
jgi:hypothetical protein